MGGRTKGTWTKERSPQKLGVWKPRQKGAKGRIPRRFITCLKKIYEEYGEEHPEVIKAAIHRGMQAIPPKSFPYLQLWSHYSLGKPVERVEISGEGLRPTRIEFVPARPTTELPEPQKELPAVTVEHIEAHPDQS